MNIISALSWRYAVREFSDEKLSDAQLQPLLEATRLSASSYGLQPYQLLVISDPTLRAALLEHSYGQRKVLESSHLIVFAAETATDHGVVDRYFDRLVAARGVSMAEVQGYADHIKSAMADKSPAARIAWAREQVFIALGTFLSAAAMYRIDTCPMTGFDPAGYDDVLGLKAKNLTAAAICAVGVRSRTDKTADMGKVRVPYGEMVRFL